MDKPIAEATPHKHECQYCKRIDGAGAEGDLSNCAYCQRVDETDASIADCAYCAEMETRDAGGCKYCARPDDVATNAPGVMNPTTQDSQNYAGQDLDAPAMPKPIPGSEPPMETAAPTDTPTNNNLNLEGQGEVTVTGAPVAPNVHAGPAEGVQVDQSKEAMIAIAQQIEQAGSPVEAAQQVDSTELAIGNNMEDNVSRPGGYADNTPGDMGLSDAGQDEGGPDMTSVLHEGLDAHADNIQREKVVQMVSGALSGFKACKPILERSQQQAPQLYQSSIMMLKAMIEMAKMLGLGQQGAPTPDGNPLESGPQANAPQGGSEWQNPFPVHPDQGGTLAAGHAPSGGKEGRIGQGVGKLPTSATTQHVPKTPITPGSVNANGQMRYVDPTTGKESFIDMKQGRVLSPTGKPVKPQ